MPAGVPWTGQAKRGALDSWPLPQGDFPAHLYTQILGSGDPGPFWAVLSSSVILKLCPLTAIKGTPSKNMVLC